MRGAKRRSNLDGGGRHAGLPRFARNDDTTASLPQNGGRGTFTVRHAQGKPLRGRSTGV
ncbi:MAG: hypothetical protein LBT00_06115 [Spirochaetaceae bacterium]|nr:hypothetical protein [Spirochaetaceae bacterium]